MPVIPATWEAEAGESVKPQEVEVAVSQDHVIALQPGQRAKLYLKNNKIIIIIPMLLIDNQADTAHHFV